MKVKPIFPTDFKTYDDAVKMAYGEINTVDLNTPLIKGTFISKRLCSLFPRLASSQVQQLAAMAEDRLVRACGENFKGMVLPLPVHQKLYRTTSKEELTQITDSIRSALDRGCWDQYPNTPPFKISESWLKGYRKLLMPFTFKPIPSNLIDAVNKALNEMEDQILRFTEDQYQNHPADFFALNIMKIVEQYCQENLPCMVSAYPNFPDGKGASGSEWGPVLAIKWYAILQDHIRNIDETQYQKEQYLQQVLQQKAISVETFMTLDIEKALDLQNEAELLYRQSLEKKPQTKTLDSKYAKLVPWIRGEENFQALWKVLVELGYVENIGYQEIISNHFYLADKYSKNNRTTTSPKIRWYGSLENLIRMIESLAASNIISVAPFEKKSGTQTAGNINNLIESHFANSDGVDYKLDAIRKAAQRKKKPEAKIDKGFNGSVLKTIRSIH